MIIIIYIGSGGRDLSGNKRTAEQSKDQALDREEALYKLESNHGFPSSSFLRLLIYPCLKYGSGSDGDDLGPT